MCEQVLTPVGKVHDRFQHASTVYEFLREKKIYIYRAFLRMER
jgi:hypothetical protein